MNREVEPIRSKGIVKQFLQYLKEGNDRDFLIAKLQLNTGTRVSEVCEAKVSDFMTPALRIRENWELKQKKRGKHRRIFINPDLRESIENYVEQYRLSYDDYLFPSQRKEYITAHSVYYRLKDAAVAQGIPNFGTHSLRKTWGYFAYLESGYDIATIMDALEKRTEKETLRYIGVSQDMKNNLYDIVRF
jgi:integrase